MAIEDKVVLACWHSHRGGSEVLFNTLKTLKNRKVDIAHVLLLCQDDQVAASLERDDIELQIIVLDIKDPTNHQDIYAKVSEIFLPEIKAIKNLHVDISPGTPAMHAVWLILHAGGELPSGSTLWSSQKNPETKRSSIALVDFPINSYLAKINSAKEHKQNLAIYRADPKSAKRKLLMQDIKRMALVRRAPLLLLGEKGTGKTRFVETIIRELKQQKIVTVACAGTNEENLRRLLWGYKNLCSDEHSESTGLLQLSDKQVLFLDDVESLPKNIQAELAAVFRSTNSRHRLLYSIEEQEVDINLVCTSGKSLSELTKVLDQDFLEFIATFVAVIPPLRDCREDIQNDWHLVWKELRPENLPEDPPITANLTDFLASEHFSGNFYDLKKIAHLIMARWTANDLATTVSMSLSDYSNFKQIVAYDHAKIKPIDADLTREEQLKIFKKKLALKGKERYKTWHKAAEMLECDEKTLRQDASQPD